MADTPEEARIREAMSEPERMRVDMNEAEQKSIHELIAADRYLEEKAAKKKGGLGIARFKIRPPGSA